MPLVLLIICTNVWRRWRIRDDVMSSWCLAFVINYSIFGKHFVFLPAPSHSMLTYFICKASMFISFSMHFLLRITNQKNCCLSQGQAACKHIFLPGNLTKTWTSYICDNNQHNFSPLHFSLLIPDRVICL